MYEVALPAFGLACLLALSGFFSGSETALMAVNRYRIGYLARRGHSRAAIVRVLIAAPDRLISAILLGNNFVNIAASALATTVALSIGGRRGVIVATFLMTALVLIFSEVAPKTLAARFPERAAFVVAGPIRLFVRMLNPVAGALVKIANIILWPFGRPHPNQQRVSEEDIRGIIEIGSEDRVIAREKRRMLDGIFTLTEIHIEDVMIPRTQIDAIPLNASPDDVIGYIRASGATRLPVYNGTLDEIVGVLHSKDVIRFWGNPQQLDLQKLMRKPFFVPGTSTLENLLRLLRVERQHLAIVIDEFGGVEGIVSLEDLLEEIVGEIEDEHDNPAAEPITELRPGVLLVEGTCPLSVLNERYELSFRSDRSATLAGWLMEASGRIPQLGDRTTLSGHTFVVERGRRHRVDRVRIELHTPAEQDYTSKS